MITVATLRRFHRVRITVFVVLAVSYMLVFFHRIAPGVVATDLMRDFSTTAAALGSLAAMYFYVYTLMQIPAGVLADTLGVRMAVSAGALIAGLGSILFGLAPDFGVASAGRFLVGLGVSVVFVGLMRSNTVWWSASRYGFISGLTIVLGNVGAVLAAGPLAAALTLASWRAVFVAVGIFSIAVAALTVALVRNRPQDAGFRSLREMEGNPPQEARNQHWVRSLSDVLRNRAIWPCFWTLFGLNGTFMAFVGLWSVPLLRDVHGLTRAEASLYPTLTLVAYAVGSLAVGWFSDYLQRRKPIVVVATIAVCLTWIAFAALPWGAGWSGWLLFAFLGFCASGFIVVFGTAKEQVAPANAGTAIAVANAGAFLGAAMAQPLFGWLMDLRWNGTVIDGLRRYHASDYAGGLWLCFGFTLLSAVASLRLRETRTHADELGGVRPTTAQEMCVSR